MSNVQKDPRDILIAPVVSEKSYTLLEEGKYTKRAIVTLREGAIDIFGAGA